MFNSFQTPSLHLGHVDFPQGKQDLYVCLVHSEQISQQITTIDLILSNAFLSNGTKKQTE